MFFKKNIRYIGPILGILLTSLLVIIFIKNQDMFEQTMDYQIQMADGFYYTNSEVQEWVDDVRDQAGIYSREIGPYIYLLICAGELPSEGYVLTLVDTLQTENEIQVFYSLVQAHPDEVSQGVTTPFMLVRVPSEWKVNLVGKFVEESEIPNFLN